MTLNRTLARLATAALTLSVAAAADAQSVPHFIAPHTYVANTVVDGPSMYWSASADFNGDGLIDLAAPDLRSLNNLLGFSVAFGEPGGGFSAPVTERVGTFIRALRADDFNHDGRADVLLITLGGAIVEQGNADGTFGAPTLVPLPLTPNDAMLADFNGDGNTDVLFPGDRGYSVALGTGTGTFSRGTLMPETVPIYWAVIGDFNRDGIQDFTGAGGIFGHTYFGHSDGTFQAPIDAGVSAMSGTVSGDFNGDGNIDMAMLSATPRQDGSNYGFRIAVGFGDGTFSAYIGYVLGQQPIGNLATGDFNGDGLADLATYITATGSLRVYAGDPSRWIGGEIYNSPYVNPGVLYAGDVDNNGSSDLVLSNSRDYTVFRNTHGQPPLLAQLAMTPAFTIGGVAAQGVVSLGGLAINDGAVVNLTSSDPAVASFINGSTVMIAAGAASATFDIATAAVMSPTQVTITAESNGVSQTAVLSVLPAYSLTGVSLSPASQYGIFTARGTLTLSAPADTAATVLLVSSNPAVANVPAAVTVPAGATSVDFTIALTPVTADTPVTITATRGDATFTSTLTVLKPADSVVITRAILTRKTSQLDVQVTSTNANTTVTVYNAANGALLGTLDNAGNGRYKGTVSLFVPANAAAPVVVVKSALGGMQSSTVQLK